MRTRFVALLLALGLLLIACADTPKPTSGVWDQSNFENATWN